MPRYWLSGEEKKLLWKLRGEKKSRADSGDYWKHLIPRTEEELYRMLDSIPDNAVEDYRTNAERFSWEERQSILLPDGTHELRTIIMEAILRNSTWYFAIIHPFTLKPRFDGLPENIFEAKEWIPQVFDIAKNNWRKATQWECEHWNDLVNCSSCKHPTIPQFDCNVCGENLIPNLQETEKRVLALICIIPDSADLSPAHGEEEGENEPEPQEKEIEEESSELEEVIEEEVSEELKEREEDEETKNTENS